MTNWKADLEAPIDETMAFAKRIHVAPPMPRTIVEPNRMPSVNWMSSEREEIGHSASQTLRHISSAS
jgi:hypothetical protein